MASYVVTFFFITGLIATGYSRPEEESHDIVSKVAEKCNEHINAPASAVENMHHRGKVDDSKEGKCLIECTLKSLGLINEDGHVNKETEKEFIHKGWKKPENQEKVQKIMDDCFAKFEAVEDHCEGAFEFLECFHEEAHKEKIPYAFKEDH